MSTGRGEAIRQKFDERYWVIHGVSYDLTDFAKKHPGGEHILYLGKGRDCTELFESVHAIAGMDKPRQLLAKYAVPSEPKKLEMFKWEENGFYSVVRKRVEEHFVGKNYKATWGVYIKLAILLLINQYCWINAFLTGNFWWAIVSGMATEMVGFCLMHDSSHYAVSKKPYVNYIGLLWSSWTLWNHWLWLQHHCYGHHSYTGIYGKDPDVHNAEIFLRKHYKMKKKSFTPFQKWYSWFLLTVIPNQHIGQAILYQVTPRLSKKVFITPTVDPPKIILYHSYLVMTLSFVWHLLVPLYFQSLSTVLLLWFCNYTMMGISYFLNVAPNHDTESTLRNHPAHGVVLDWGEHQVRCTGNHSLGDGIIDRIITQLWGGMNYQIEHHLFPTLNHAHYPEVSKIVQKTCKEFNIPYNVEGDWLSAIRSYGKFIGIMADIPQGQDPNLSYTEKS